ncbi:hypothetical protein OHA21_15645 [Actinoplanes sp. NBC_00393]|uniref:hypothetical protein n=1 Tax=Actinoplanes sp. NBC_00393 TaxID=2975953 RepID=UPI002E1D57D6
MLGIEVAHVPSGVAGDLHQLPGADPRPEDPVQLPRVYETAADAALAWTLSTSPRGSPSLVARMLQDLLDRTSRRNP